MAGYARKLKLSHFCRKRKPQSAYGAAARPGTLIVIILLFILFASTPAISFTRPVCVQQTHSAQPPVIVQPGAPGKPSKTLPPSTRATLPPSSQADVEFMQGMIMHHSQAVEMTALIPSHTKNKALRSLGARISSSQSDEIKFMQRWLAARGEPISMPMQQIPEMPDPKIPDMDKNMDHSSQPVATMAQMQMMPGMLTPEQMEVLRQATGAKFDRLFLAGMIQHHNGALIMVKDLFGTAGAGQDAELFNFATDADNTQRAEIRIMQSMLETKPSQSEKQPPELEQKTLEEKR
jgi:uncharacterized protein (DUF305 family)